MVSLMGAVIAIVVGIILLVVRSYVNDRIAGLVLLIIGLILVIVGAIYLLFYFLGPALFILG